MVGQVVAMKAVDSATNDGGILNNLIKIVTVVSILGGLVVLGVILFLAFNIWDAVGGTFETLGSIAGSILTPVSFFNPITLFTTVIVSGFGFGRK